MECYDTQVSDLTPLQGMPLKQVRCDFKPFRDAEILRSIKTLDKINEKSAKQFWSEVDAEQTAFEAWCKEVAALPADHQVEAVAGKLKELNPGFDGKVTHKTSEDGKVKELRFVSDNVADISPVRALADLKALSVKGTAHTKGLCEDLSPLRGMGLTSLGCELMRLSDLSPLEGMPLTSLACTATRVSDLSPLKGMDLAYLRCNGTGVRDLSPLRGLPLKTLVCNGTMVSDLSPLKNMPLKELGCDFKRFRDTETLRPIKSLEKINGKTAAGFWKEVDAEQAAFETWCKEVAALPAEKQVEAVAQKLQELNPGFDGKVTSKAEREGVTELKFETNKVTDISPVRALPSLKKLDCSGTNSQGELADLSPLIGMKLTYLCCAQTKVYDLSPLKDIKLTMLQFNNTPVSDLSPLREIPLNKLYCHRTPDKFFRTDRYE